MHCRFDGLFRSGVLKIRTIRIDIACFPLEICACAITESITNYWLVGIIGNAIHMRPVTRHGQTMCFRHAHTHPNIVIVFIDATGATAREHQVFSLRLAALSRIWHNYGTQAAAPIRSGISALNGE